MTFDHVLNKVKDLVAEISSDNSRITEASDLDDLFNAGILDSVSILSLVIELELSFGIEIPLETISPSTFDSIQNIATFTFNLLEHE